ncbi:Cellulose binding domain-containing protein [Actinomadura meyerae]|uniref:Cellulose binding domain-containing protein n=1 Tax=Actinomadura meyerae TaxID=240840 RepID=A0A239E235_9ACTN|nr:cellulose binding domain-containing protein [Actinomadura meyerae]SNS38667.1 Cellulose binding domain-containing protein [Actinomadura meyerae]
MGRHSRHERPGDEGAPGNPPSREPYYAAPADPSYDPSYDASYDPSYDAFSGPTDDRVYVSSYERPRSGPPPAEGYRFDPLPGDYPGDYPGAPAPDLDPAYAPEDPLDGPLDRPRAEASGEPDGGRGFTKFIAKLPLPLLPIVALVVAVGSVSYALSTQQISLNFAGGGAPRDTEGNPRDSQVSQRGPGERAGRGTGRADGLVISFKVASKSPGAFKATATIANKGQAPVPKWALAFTIPDASVTAISGATVVRTGRLAFVRGRSAIAPGDAVRIVFTARGTAAEPTTCVLNKLPCALI